MNGWHGVKRRRREPFTGGPRALPTRRVYLVRAGLPCTIRRAGDPQWRRFTTTAENRFDAVHDEGRDRLVFFVEGWELEIARGLVETVEEKRGPRW